MRRPTATRFCWSRPANAINATLYDKLNFNFIRDIAPVAGIIRVPNVMEVHPSVPAKTVPEFIAYAKANPGKLNMASAGIGTSIHLSGELFKMMTGVNMVHVPYRGAAPALTDLIAGQVQVMFDNMPPSIRAHQGRQAARAGGDHARARSAAAAGRSDRRRLRARLRGERLVRRRRAAGHAAEIIEQAQQARSTRASPIPQSRRGSPTGRSARRLARRFRQADRRRNREVRALSNNRPEQQVAAGRKLGGQNCRSSCPRLSRASASYFNN